MAYPRIGVQWAQINNQYTWITVPSPYPTDGLIARYTFEETSGTTAYDDTGNYNLTQQNTSYITINQTGKVGKSYYFAGTTTAGGYLKATAAPLNGLSAFTISLWIYKVSASDSRFGICGSKSGTNYWMMRVNDNYLDWYFITTGTTVAGHVGTYPSNTSWHHIACTYNGSTLTTYLDNTIVDNARTLTGTLNSGALFEIGGLTYENIWYLTGSVDQFYLYNRALSTAEVSQLYNVGAGI